MKKILLFLFTITFIFSACRHNSGLTEISISDETAESAYTKMLIPELDHGRAVFFELPTKEYVLADCGDAKDYPKLCELIRAFDISFIDYIILTSEQPSSMGGIEKILSDFSVGEVCVSAHMKGTKAYHTITAFAGQNGTDVSLADEGTRIYDYDNVFIDVISSEKITTSAGAQTAMSIMLTHGSKKIFIEGPGDIVSENKTISGKSHELISDILVIPTEASEDIPGELFLQTVSPDYVLIPVYGGILPANSLHDRLDKQGITMLRTDNDGTLQFTFNGEDYVCKKER